MYSKIPCLTTIKRETKKAFNDVEREKRGEINCYMLIPPGMASLNNLKHRRRTEKERDQSHLSIKDFQTSTSSGHSERHCSQCFPLQPLKRTLCSKFMFFLISSKGLPSTISVFIIELTNWKVVSKTIEPISQVSSKDIHFVLDSNHEI